MLPPTKPALGALLLGLSLTASAAAPDVHTGLWETTLSTEMPGMPGMSMSMPPITYSSCIRENDLVPKNEQPGQDCQVLETNADGGEVSWRMRCTSQGANFEGNGRVTYTGDSFSGRIVMDMAQGGQSMQMIQNLQGHRLGECP